MDIETILDHVSSWSRDERFRLVDEPAILAPEELREIDLRIAKLDTHPERAVTWEEIQKRVMQGVS